MGRQHKQNRVSGTKRASLMESLEDRRLLTVFTVTNTADSGTGSFRWALDQSNNTPGMDTIAFSITTADKTITPASPLPLVYDAAIIDGTTQPGYTGRPLVQIDGSKAGGAGTDGLKLFGNDTVKGLSITRFGGQGITTIPRTDVNYGGNTIQANWIGVDTAGRAAGNASHGVGLYSNSNLVGGPNIADRNVISANTGGNGVFALGTLFGGGHGYNTIQNNIIGLDVSGTVAMGNINGIGLQDSPGNKVINNVLSANRDDGLLLMNPSTQTPAGTLATGNIVGLDITGSVAMGNGLYGMEVQSANNTIGGTTGNTRNIISANHTAGIVFWKSGAFGSKVLGNFIGTDITGTLARGNTEQGIAFSDAGGNTIGGTTAGSGNVISANGHEGIGIFPGSGEIIQGNTIGASSQGKPLGNGTWGITVINGSSGVIIGGTAAGAGNYIAFNGTAPIWTSSPSVATIIGNSYDSAPVIPTPTPTPTPAPAPAPTPTPTPAPAKIGFTATETVANVADGYARVTIIRSGDASKAATVYCATLNGTGKSGVVYKPSTATLNFAAGQTSLTFSVRLYTTTAAGRTPTFQLRLSAPTGATLATTSTTTVTVVEYAKAGRHAPVPPVSTKRHHAA